MVKIILEGWRVGMRKIPFIKLLNERSGLSLTESKRIKDRLVDNGEVIEILTENEKIANELLGEMIKLGVKARIESTP